jgi:hypothetical protein
VAGRLCPAWGVALFGQLGNGCGALFGVAIGFLDSALPPLSCGRRPARSQATSPWSSNFEPISAGGRTEVADGEPTSSFLLLPPRKGVSMSLLPSLEVLDQDGAIRESAEKVGGNTRASFLRKAGVGVGAVMGGGAFLGAAPAAFAGSRTSASDVDILNFALTLEFLEAAFYTEAVAKGRFGGDVGKFAKVVKAHEVAHVKALQGALGAKAVKQPKFDFKGTTSDEAKFKATAQVLEDTGVAAYLGQVGNIKSKAILLAAGSILPIEARHAGWIRQINGAVGAPVAFEKGKTDKQILAAVKGTGFIVG